MIFRAASSWFCSLSLAGLAASGGFLGAGHAQEVPPFAPGAEGRAPAEAVEAWQDLRFGMFIHWGPVTLRGTEIGWSRGKEVPAADYDQLYTEFNPTQFDAAQWVDAAKAAGMRYIVLVAKHHDGFCLWDSADTDYDIMAGPFRRDVVRELADATRAAGLEFGLYYSTNDWWHPAFPNGGEAGKETKPTADLAAYDRYLTNQVSDLIQNYGPLLTVWFDVPQSYNYHFGVPMVRHLRELQPDLLVNSRAFSVPTDNGNYDRVAVGDYATPEQKIGDFNLERPWETCMTICNQWAWKPNDQMKSLEECLHTLVRVAGGDGNLLFNVGPMLDGRMEQRQVQRLAEMGQWLEENGESIYGTRGGPWLPTAALASTRKDRTIFLHVLQSPEGQLITLPAPAGATVQSASLMDGTAVEVQSANGTLTLSVPAGRWEEIDTVIRLQLDRDAMEIASLAAE